MKQTLAYVSLLVFSTIAIPWTAWAQMPAKATGECKDGTYTEAAMKDTACATHGGVKTWFADHAAKPKAAAAAPVASPEAKPASSKAGAATDSKAKHSNSAMPATAAPGGGPGKVWVNTSSKVYHCSSDKWYGKTKQGEYLSEAEAKAKGFHSAEKKACE